MNQRTKQAGRRLGKLGHQITATAGAVHLLAGGLEDVFDLLIQLVAVCDDGHAGVGVVLQNPLGQQHHDDALAASLRVPDDAALLLVDMRLGDLDAEILVHARQFLHAAVEQYEIINKFDEPFLPAHLEQVLVDLVAGVVLLVLLPFEEVFFWREDRAVLQSLRVVPSEDDLHSAEETGVELRLLVGKQLADAVADAHRAAFERHFLGDCEIVFLRVLPVKELQRLRDLARLGLDWHTVAQQLVHLLVVAVQAAVGVARLGTELVQGDADLLWRVAASFQPVGKQRLLDVAVAAAVAPVAQVAIVELVAEEGDDTVLRRAFVLSDDVHITPSPV